MHCLTIAEWPMKTPLFCFTFIPFAVHTATPLDFLYFLRVFGSQHPLKVNPSSFIVRLAGRVRCLSLSF